MFLLGLTGGIACGKSTVATRLTQLGARVLDGDQVAREVVQPGQPGLAAIVQHFGAQMLLADGTLNRPKLGQLIFTHDPARLQLNALLHPLIAARLRELADQARTEGVRVSVLDVPLLLEMHLELTCDAIWTVECRPETQLQRLMTRNQLTEPEAKQRIAAQWSADQRRQRATVVLDNDGTLAELLERVDHLWQQLPQPT